MGHVPLPNERKILLVFTNEPPTGMFAAVRELFRAEMLVEEHALQSANVFDLRALAREGQERGDHLVVELGACGLFFGDFLRRGFTVYQLEIDGGAVNFSRLGGMTLPSSVPGREGPETTRIPLVAPQRAPPQRANS